MHTLAAAFDRFRPVRRPAAVAALALCAAAGLAVASGSPASTRGAPRQPSVFLAPNGSDSAPCTRQAPCRSFQRAYRKAEAGQIVQVAGGSYPGQSIEADGRKLSRNIVFRPAGKARVQIRGDFDIYASRMTFRGTGRATGFEFWSWYAKPGSHHLAFDRVTSRVFIINGASNVSITGGQVGPFNSCFEQSKCPNQVTGEDAQVKSTGNQHPTNIRIEGVYVHDFSKRLEPESHTDCIQFLSGKNVVIRRNVFKGCSDASLFIKLDNDGAMVENFLIENNVFGPTTNPTSSWYTVQIARSPEDFCRNVVFRYNTVVEKGVVFDCSPPRGSPGEGLMYGNLLPHMGEWTCAKDSSQGHQPVRRFNYYEARDSARCHSTDTRGDGNADFVDRARGDYRLRPTSDALGKGDPSRFPRTDLRGRRRPEGSRPDAGAYERP